MPRREGWRLQLALLVGALVLLACKGSSILESATGHGRAAVTFEVTCEAGLAAGQFTLHDGPADVHFRAESQASLSDCDEQPDFFTGTTTGTYEPIPPGRGEGGTFTLSVVDLEPRGPSGSDTFDLTLEGGIYDGYHNEGSWLHGRWTP